MVGPNGVGKTTVLQALRICKAILASRTQQEVMQVLISLSAASPHFPQKLFLNSLARNPALPVEIRCTYTLSANDLRNVALGANVIAQAVVSSRLGQNFQNPALLVQFMQSEQGLAALMTASTEINAIITGLSNDPILVLGVTMDCVAGTITAAVPIAGNIVAFLDQRLPPDPI